MFYTTLFIIIAANPLPATIHISAFSVRPETPVGTFEVGVGPAAVSPEPGIATIVAAAVDGASLATAET